MRSLTRLSRLTRLVLLALFAVPAAAVACRCPSPPLAPKLAFKRAVLVVEAEVTSVSVPDADGAYDATLHVTRAWKQAVEEKLKVHTATDCAYPFTTGERYLLFLYRAKDGSFFTARCDGNVEEKEAAATQRWLDAHAHALALLPAAK